MTPIRNYQYPQKHPRSQLYDVTADGIPVPVLHTNCADFAAFDWLRPVVLEIAVKVPFGRATLRPTCRNIVPECDGRNIRIHLARPQNLCLEVEGLIELFIYANPEEQNRPQPGDPKVRLFSAGQTYEAGELEIGSGETLYIEGGAIVRGCVRALGAENIRLCGRGILDGSLYRGGPKQLVLLENCRGVRVDDLILIEPTSWMLVLGACENAQVRNLKEIGEVVCSDGIDICGSRRVLIEGCCLRNNDDNIAIKAVSHVDRGNGAKFPWDRDVEDVVVRGCMLWNAAAGNAMEIGYETRTESIRNIRFEDIDVLCVHGHGAVFSIHNGDRATVEHVRWENIRIEHHFDKLIDFRVMESRYSKDSRRGRIRDISLKNIRVAQSPANRGHTVSLISGFGDAPAEHIVIEDLWLNERKVTHADALDLHTRNVAGVRIL